MIELRGIKHTWPFYTTICVCCCPFNHYNNWTTIDQPGINIFFLRRKTSKRGKETAENVAESLQKSNNMRVTIREFSISILFVGVIPLCGWNWGFHKISHRRRSQLCVNIHTYSVGWKEDRAQGTLINGNQTQGGRDAEVLPSISLNRNCHLSIYLLKNNTRQEWLIY